MKFILILAVILGLYWCFNNINFDNIKNTFITGAKNGSIVKSVNDGRTKIYNDSSSVMDN